MKKLLLIGVMAAFLSGCAVPQQKKESLSEKWAKQDELALKGEVTDKTDKFTGEREIKWQVSGIVNSRYTQTIVPEKFSVIKDKKQYNELLITKKGRSPV